MPALSVVVPTFNRWAQLEQVLTGLAGQTVPRAELEIIVVSDGSTDETDDRLNAGAAPLPVTFLQQPNQGPAVARNAGVAAATGDLILFIDDDVVAEPECAAVHLEAHDRADRPTVVIGPLLTPEDRKLEPWIRWEQRMLYKQYDAMARGDWAPTARQFYTGNASLSRLSFEATGGFDPSFRRGEDVELAYRLVEQGLAFSFEFGAKALHHASRSYESWISIARAYGRNDVRLWRDRGQTWLMPTVRKEFDRRNALTRRYAKVGLQAPWFDERSSRVAVTVAKVSERAGIDIVGQAVLSAVYNLAYYRGVTDELGGLDDFFSIEPAVPREAPTAS